MTAQELSVALSTLNPNAVVWTEGCDCWGGVASIEPQADGTVLLRRPPE